MGLFSPRYPDGAAPERKPTRAERRRAVSDDATRQDLERLQLHMEDLAGITTEAQRKAWRATFGTTTNPNR